MIQLKVIYELILVYFVLIGPLFVHIWPVLDHISVCRVIFEGFWTPKYFWTVFESGVKRQKVKLQPHSPFWLSSFISVATLSLRVTTLSFIFCCFCSFCSNICSFPFVSANTKRELPLNRSPNWKETHFSANLSNYCNSSIHFSLKPWGATWNYAWNILWPLTFEILKFKVIYQFFCLRNWKTYNLWTKLLQLDDVLEI